MAPRRAAPWEGPFLHTDAKDQSREALLERALRAERRAAALIAVGQIVSGGGRTVSEVLREIAALNVRDLADLSLVHILDDRAEKGLLTTAVAARDPLLADAVSAHLAEQPIRFDEHVAGKIVYETRSGILITEVTPEDVARLTRPGDARLMEFLGIRSVIVVPLRGREGVIGTMDFVLTDAARRYGPEEFDLAQEIADRAAALVENMRLMQQVDEERARLAHLAELAAARARRLEAIISCMADAVFVADAGGRVVLVNEAAVKLAGAPRERLLIPLADYPAAFSVRGPGGGPIEDPVGVRVMRGEVVKAAERVIRDAASGAARHLRLSAAPLRDEAGRIEGAVIVAVDISDQKELERAKDEFLSIASHELKTPLTPILSIAELIGRGAERGEAADPEIVERLVRQVRRLRGLIGEMLDVARWGEGRLEIERAPFALRTMVDHLVEEYRAAAGGHEIISKRPDVPATVNGDEQRIGEVIANLLDNAVKYTPRGGRIEVALAVAAGTAEVAVSDDGIGIPAEDLPHIFERFRRGRNVSARHYGGLGLGLFISRETVRLHGGDMRVESVEGRGTRVVMTLPVVEYNGK